MNLQVLKKSRKKPVAGDIFVFKIDEHFRFGLVVSAEATLGINENFLIIYLYNYESEKPILSRELRMNDLLVPPIITSSHLWSGGIFENIRIVDIADQEVLKRHCFVNYEGDKFYDEFGKRLAIRIEPCGEKGIFTDSGIDQLLSKALGLRIPTDEDYMNVGNDVDNEDESEADPDEPHFVEIMFNPEDLATSGIEDLMTIEDALDDTFAKAGGFASWSGNGISADFVHIDLDVQRDSLDKAVRLISKVLKKLQAPASTYVNVDGTRKELKLS